VRMGDHWNRPDTAARMMYHEYTRHDDPRVQACQVAGCKELFASHDLLRAHHRAYHIDN